MVVSIYMYVHMTQNMALIRLYPYISGISIIKSWSSYSLKPIAVTLHLTLVECLVPSHDKAIQALIYVTVEGANYTGGQICIIWDL